MSPAIEKQSHIVAFLLDLSTRLLISGPAERLVTSLQPLSLCLCPG